VSGRVLRWLAVSILLLLVAVPLYWIVVTSLKTGRQILMSQAIYIAKPFTLENYTYLFEETRFVLWLRNSAVTAVASTILSLAIGAAGAYALTRLRFAGRRAFGALVLITYLVPPGLMFIPLYRTLIQIGYTNSLGTLILAYPTFLVPFVTWLLMGFFRSIPRELEEAALVDGADLRRAVWYVVLPLALPGLIAAGIFTFILAWNDFLFALVLITSDELKTLPVGVNDLFNATIVDWGMIMAAGVMITVPTIAFFVAVQRYLIQGWGAGGVKG
jgi:ABC-type glycerol-3-phosphate transport system permease component